MLLSLVFVLEVSAAIAAFALQSQVSEMLIRTMQNAIAIYKQPYMSESVDFMQSTVSAWLTGAVVCRRFDLFCLVTAPMLWRVRTR